MLVGIPDGETIIDQGMYHQILTEHINYYSLSSISMLIRKCGFSIVEIERDARLLEMNLYIRKIGELSPCSQVFNRQKNDIEKAVGGLKKVVAWGGGAKATSYSNLLEGVPIWAVVDSDSSKVGKYISNIDVPIGEVNKETILQSEAVIILASAYNDDIISLLDSFKYRGKIIYFDHIDNRVHVLKRDPAIMA